MHCSALRCTALHFTLLNFIIHFVVHFVVHLVILFTSFRYSLRICTPYFSSLHVPVHFALLVTSHHVLVTLTSPSWSLPFFFTFQFVCFSFGSIALFHFSFQCMLSRHVHLCVTMSRRCSYFKVLSVRVWVYASTSITREARQVDAQRQTGTLRMSIGFLSSRVHVSPTFFSVSLSKTL